MIQMNMTETRNEWLETNGLGGFASGIVGGWRTRRYHGLLTSALNPPTERMVFVNGLEVSVVSEGREFALSSQYYGPNVFHPDGAKRLTGFTTDPWPTWHYDLATGAFVTQEVFMPHGQPAVVVSWRYSGSRPAYLRVRPLVSGRDYHSLHHENGAFNASGCGNGARMEWQFYAGQPKTVALSNGGYREDFQWYRNFLYTEERARGLDFGEDLASPGEYRWEMGHEPCVLIFQTEVAGKSETPESADDVSAYAAHLHKRELARRSAFVSPLHRAADAYISKRGEGLTIIAGYHWFTDWGRDTFIAIRGLCLATGRLEVAGRIISQWSRAVSEGMLPNFFPDGHSEPEYNSVDAPLWYCIAASEFLDRADDQEFVVGAEDRASIRNAILSIVEAYARGTRHGIRGCDDGLLACGGRGVQLTWMDAKIGDWVVTPRTGKPVEVQALWLNAVRIAGAYDPKWLDRFDAGMASFRARFWNEALGCLYDVVDVDHVPGMVDATLRPNQILAIGGLPVSLLSYEQSRSVLKAVETALWTPLGLRSLAPIHREYRPHYEGGVLERDSAYHQGTVWPWLIGPFVEAWLRVNGNAAPRRQAAYSKYLAPLMKHLREAGLGHVSEIVDAEPPYTPRGCPFQAWSLGELIRALALVDKLPNTPAPRNSKFLLAATPKA